MHDYRLITINCSYRHLQCHIICYDILSSHCLHIVVICIIYYIIAERFMFLNEPTIRYSYA